MLPKRFLFHFRLNCRRADVLWKNDRAALDESFRLPNLDELEFSPPSGKAASVSGTSGPLDFRIGWNSSGLALSMHLSGKSRPLRSRQQQPEESDGLQICLDTRDVRNVHRATRFCHRLVFLPGTPGPRGEKPSAVWIPIHRAKNHPNPVAVERMAVRTEFFDDGYRLDAQIPADILTGFDPDEHPVLGFHYVVVDQELGSRYFLVGPPFPHDQDPSLWASLELADEKKRS